MRHGACHFCITDLALPSMHIAPSGALRKKRVGSAGSVHALWCRIPVALGLMLFDNPAVALI